MYVVMVDGEWEALVQRHLLLSSLLDLVLPYFGRRRGNQGKQILSNCLHVGDGEKTSCCASQWSHMLLTTSTGAVVSAWVMEVEQGLPSVLQHVGSYVEYNLTWPAYALVTCTQAPILTFLELKELLRSSSTLSENHENPGENTTTPFPQVTLHFRPLSCC